MKKNQILKVSRMAENLTGSEIIKLAGEIRERIQRGEQIYNFTIGDFDPSIFPIPVELKSGIIAAYEKGETNYPPADGMLQLRKSVAGFLKTRGGLEYGEQQILIAGGARPLIYTAYRTLVDPGDTVIVPVPSWNNNHYCHQMAAKPAFIETTASHNFMPTADEIAPHIEEASLIALCSPQNPTGTVFDRNELARICQLVISENRSRKKGVKPLYVLYDQIYWMLTSGKIKHYDPVSLFPEMRDYTLYIDGISKSFAATGVRVGWAFGPQRVLDKMKAILGHIGAWAPRAEQIACAGFLSQNEAVDRFLLKYRADINSKLFAFHEGFQQLKKEGFPVDSVTPQAAIYLTAKIDITGAKTQAGVKLATTADATAYLLDEARIALVPFYAFGAGLTSPWYRLSVGTAVNRDIGKFFIGLRDALGRLIKNKITPDRAASSESG
ncbi:MAG: aminotransferase class I/II-fold pyridoxal phosphate-dependent enzyme [Candidatus Wallbacteria bacterium]|nr:aminotransferase class I/II-fold pyridoxal phosphate-dependent enzyme [Candidatus Wallbacteria bacterium]